MSWSSTSSSSSDNEQEQYSETKIRALEGADTINTAKQDSKDMYDDESSSDIDTDTITPFSKELEVMKARQNALLQNDQVKEVAVHGQNAFLGSTLDPLHPDNLNQQQLASYQLESEILEAMRYAPNDNGEPMDKASRGSSKDLQKGCPPEVQSQFRELLDAGLVS